MNAQVSDLTVSDITEKTKILITGADVIYGQLQELMVVPIEDTGKGSAVKIRIGIIGIRCNNGGGVGSAGEVDIGLQAGEAGPVIRVSGKLVEIRQ